MSRDQIGVGLDQTWAANGDRSEIGDFEEGFGPEYEIDALPDRSNTNDVLAKATAVSKDVNFFGAFLPWDTAIDYEDRAGVIGSDGRHYVAQISNQGVDPVGASPTVWKTLRSYLGIDDLYTDQEYVEITSTTDEGGQLSKSISSGSVDYSYTIANLSGSGLVTDQIRTIWVRCKGHADQDHTDVGVFTKYPGSASFINLLTCAIQETYGDPIVRGALPVPVNIGQIAFELRLSAVGGINSEFEIIGATQRRKEA